ncbi:Nicotinate dehydrogenase subunit B [Posidoniimonas corsicana]|uniref:Nicotinate dehydrogenase subunit B n=1 Tax=Posidoniimonas corsicana TaxID=1938618 RepID=A0A5C5VD08_9BACT|nr:molybdopterin cofactor-binding domain-containing protein [Posidoniimonas corsicana]TWT35759.1 Nicotinate dehydrogenase subunit B [Posidoniimonas corsicana]
MPNTSLNARDRQASDGSFDEQLLAEERYELREQPRYSFRTDRRAFVQTLGAGLVVAAASSHVAAQRRGGRRRVAPEELSDRLHIGEDGRVTLFTSKVEVGQGSRTQLTQAAAEELSLPLDQIELVMADTLLCPDDGGTAGSRTTPSTVPRVRSACAAARVRLAAAAAATLGVAVDQVELRDGAFQGPDGLSIGLGELAKQEPLAGGDPGNDQRRVELRRVEQWHVMGESVPKVGAREIVTGAHRYTSDIQLPGMLYGKVLRAPAYNAKLISYSTDTAQTLDGVRVVEDASFVGCVAPTSHQAANAIEAIVATAEWQRGEHPSSSGLDEHLRSTADGARASRRGGREWGEAPSDDVGLKTLSASYSIAYIQHAPMEPRAAVAKWEDGMLTVWTGTQQPARVHGELREAFGLPAERVRVIVPDTGGGFGGKHTGEAAVEAARLAKGAGRPVSLRWTREEEFTWAYFRPAGVIDVNAAVDADGRLRHWDFTNINSGGSAIETPYRSPSGRTRFLQADSPLRQGSYRALASTANVFAREAAMDELAQMAGIDPLSFRLAHLEAGRLRDVLESVAEKSNFKRRWEAGEPVGLACGTEKGSFVAACAEAIIEQGAIRVKSVCQAYECGAIHNPANVRSQVEGSIVMGLGGALTEQIEFENGAISNPSFSTYSTPRMADLPELDVVLLDRQDLPSVGAGETPLIAVAPAIANALYRGTGTPRRTMPLQVLG